MEYRSLGSLPFRVSAIGFGTWALGGPADLGGQPVGWGLQDKKTSIQAIRRALDLGVTFFDTADIYGMGISEEILGEGLGPDSQRSVICTKCGVRCNPDGQVVKDFSTSWIEKAVNHSLLRLKREWIDLLLLHSPPDDTNWNSFDREGLERLKKSGKIRGYGVSCRSYRGAEKVISENFGDAIEAIYNLLDRRLSLNVLPAALKSHVGVIARVPLASGFLTGKFIKGSSEFNSKDVRSRLSSHEIQWRNEMVNRLKPLETMPGGLTGSALRFCLSHPGVSTVIPGMRTPDQVDENLSIADLGPLPAPWASEIERLVPHVYPGWQS